MKRLSDYSALLLSPNTECGTVLSAPHPQAAAASHFVRRPELVGALASPCEADCGWQEAIAREMFT